MIMYTLKHRKGMNPITMILETDSIAEAVRFVSNLPRATIGEEMRLSVGGINVAYVGAPRWYESQDFLNGGIEINPMVVISAESLNFVRNPKSDTLDLVKALNDWAWVNRPEQVVKFKDGDAGLRIDAGYVMIDIACGSRDYVGYPFTLSYDSGVTKSYYASLEEMRRYLVAHDIALKYN